MKDQSHKHEMSAALRADFERLRARGVEPTLTCAEPLDDASAAADPPDGEVLDSWVDHILRRD